MTHSVLQRMDFEDWADLANTDPDIFEELRSEFIDEIISRSPDQVHQQRLRGLQWRIDMVRDRAKNPLDACIRMYDMMWDSVLGTDGMLETLEYVRSGAEQRCTTTGKADILPFLIPDSVRPRRS